MALNHQKKVNVQILDNLRPRVKPVPSDLQFMTKHFKVLATNLNYNDRKTYEAIKIEKYDNSKKTK